MTSTNVTQAAGIFPGISGVNAGGAARGADEGFSQIMSRASQEEGGRLGGKEQGAAKTSVRVERSNIRKTGGVKETDDSMKAQKDTPGDAKAVSEKDGAGKAVSDETEKDETTKMEEVLGAVAEAAEEIKKAISEALGLSEEETEALIEQLGLTNADLLNPDMMRQIVMATAGESDQLSILTNEALYADVQRLTETAETIVSDLRSQFSMEDAEFAELLAQAETAETGNAAEAIAETVSGEEKTPVILVSEERAPEETRETVKSSREEAGTEQKAPETKPEESVGEAGERSAEIRTERRQDASEEHTAGGRQESGGHFMQDVQKSAVEAWNDNVAEARASYQEQAADTQRIMEQITEYMKVEVKPETTELELRLHPESLGNVHIHLAAKEGVITAQLTAENESVRAVLEAQTAQLRESLNEQGVKVEAVEVTVASHAFDRSFADSGDGESGREEPKKKGVRRLRLSDDVPVEEMELSDEERIAAEMMEQNGNTVDYTA